MRINLGADTADLFPTAFEVVRARNPWLRLARCCGCGRPWYVAVDTVDDDYYFRALSAADLTALGERNAWPPDFDDFVNVWPSAGIRDHGARVHWPWQGQTVDLR